MPMMVSKNICMNTDIFSWTRTWVGVILITRMRQDGVSLTANNQKAKKREKIDEKIATES